MYLQMCEPFDNFVWLDYTHTNSYTNNKMEPIIGAGLAQHK